MTAQVRVDHYVSDNIVMNVPEWFCDPEFLTAINDESKHIATWHRRGSEPNEYSDVMLFVDPGLSGEGSEEGQIPERYWLQVVDACRQHCRPDANATHIMVRLTNLDE